MALEGEDPSLGAVSLVETGVLEPHVCALYTDRGWRTWSGVMMLLVKVFPGSRNRGSGKKAADENKPRNASNTQHGMMLGSTATVVSLLGCRRLALS